MREKVVAATLVVISREGIEGASVRAIARQMGVTTGVISHHFADKSELLAFAFSAISEAISAEVRAAQHLEDAEAALLAIASAFLSDTPKKALRWRVWLAFLAAALPDPAQLALQEAHYAMLRRLVVSRLRDLGTEGRLKPGRVPDEEADLLIAVMDGVGLHGVILAKTISARRQRRLVELHIKALLRDSRSQS